MKNWINKWKALWNPERFHGWGRRRQYFEGWYFKCVTPDEQEALAFIPGIAYDRVGEGHSFIQVMDGHRMQARYYRFPWQEFEAEPDYFEVRIGKNLFSEKKIVLDLPEIQGEINLEGLTPWPKTKGAPGIMGWYSFVPFMECNHGIVSLNHQLTGRLNFLGSDLDFNGGKGYAEKDWGKSFPKAYVWLQSNHFTTGPDISLMASIAHIPWLGSYFPGFICGFWFGGKLYRFTTYSGASCQFKMGENFVQLIFRNKNTELRIFATQAPGVALVSPLHGEMAGKVNESLKAEVNVEFLENGELRYSGTGRHTGLELAGDLSVLNPLPDIQL